MTLKVDITISFIQLVKNENGNQIHSNLAQVHSTRGKRWINNSPDIELSSNNVVLGFSKFDLLNFHSSPMIYKTKSPQ